MPTYYCRKTLKGAAKENKESLLNSLLNKQEQQTVPASDLIEYTMLLGKLLMDYAVVALPMSVFLLFFPTDKITKYCDEAGNWIQTGSTCHQTLKDKLEVIVCWLFSLKRTAEQNRASVSICSNLIIFVPSRRSLVFKGTPQQSQPRRPRGLAQRRVSLKMKRNAKRK